MIDITDCEVKYKSATPMEDAEKRAARREWYKVQAWFVEIEHAVAERERYRSDRDAAAAHAPERTRNFVAGADWALAGIAILAALDAVQGTDEHGIRRAVPASAKFLADLLAVFGFGDGLKAETVDRYSKLLLHLLAESKRLVLVREAKRVSGDKGDGDSREWLVYVGGREIVANEPHAEPRCWRKPKPVEQPRPPREPRAEPEAAKLAPANPNEPTPAAVRFKAEDAAECAQRKFEAHGEKRRAPSRVSACGSFTAPAGQARGSPGEWLQAITAGRMSLHDAIRRGFVRQ